VPIDDCLRITARAEDELEKTFSIFEQLKVKISDDISTKVIITLRIVFPPER